MRDEGLLMEHIKDAVSFVSTDLKSDLARAKGSADLRLEYVLPDGLSHARGYARAPVPLVRGETRREQVRQYTSLQYRSQVFLCSLASETCIVVRLLSMQMLSCSLQGMLVQYTGRYSATGNVHQPLHAA